MVLGIPRDGYRGTRAVAIMVEMVGTFVKLWSALLTAALFPVPPGIVSGYQSTTPTQSFSPSERAAIVNFHARAIVVDTHADTTQRIVYQGADFLAGIPDAHLDLAKMRAGEIDAQFFSIFVFPKRTPPEAFFSESLLQVKAIQDMVARSDGRLALARSASDVRANVKRGVPSVLLGVEGGHSLGVGTAAEQLAHLRKFAAEGVRYMTLTWSNSNAIGGSSGDDGDGRGLTAFGRQVIDEMQKLGIIIDLSHVSDPLFWDAIRYATKPIILSHSSARSLANVPRNANDAMMRAVAKNGGAICVNFNPAFLDSDYNRAQGPLWGKYKDFPVDQAWRRIRADSALLYPVPLSRLADHLMHMVQVAGVDHVCLGSDFDGIPATPRGLEDARQLPELTLELRARGMSEGDLEKILGANTLRVLESNEVH